MQPFMEVIMFGAGAGGDMLQQDVGAIMGVLVGALAFVMNLILNAVSALTERNSIGITIILATIVLRLLMLPQGIQMVKSQMKMRLAKPEIDKIKKKYGNTKDPETMRKVQAETQEVYRKHKINMFGGCLPLLITMPIFIAFIDLMRRLPVYLNRVRDLYDEICYTLIHGIEGFAEQGSILWDIAVTKVPANFIQNLGRPLDIRVVEDLRRFIDTFTDYEWATITDYARSVDPAVYERLNILWAQRVDMQSFLGLNLVANAGLGWPGIMIPIFSGGTSFLLSFMTSKTMPAQEQSMRMNQMIMMVVMPAMMFFFTINISGGVGVYWITGNIFAIIQQLLLVKFLFKNQNGGTEIIGKTKD